MNLTSAMEQNFNFLYEMCIKEYDESTKHLKTYFNLTNAIRNSAISTKNDKATLLLMYNKALKTFSIISEALREFNIQAELKTEEIKILEPSIFGLAEQQQDEPTIVAGIEQATAKNDVNVATIPKFLFPPNDLSMYFNNYESDCIVTYVKNAAEKLFYIRDTNSEVHKNKYLDMSQLIHVLPSKLNSLPNPDVVFGYYADNYMFRAVRQCQPDNQLKSNIKLFLIDIGETINYTPNAMIYALPENLVRIPSQAILCRLDKTFDGSDPEQFLKDSLYVDFKFKIMHFENKHTLNVQLYPIKNKPTVSNPFDDSTYVNESTTSTSEPLDFPSTNPFAQFRYKNTQKTNQNHQHHKQRQLNDSFAEMRMNNGTISASMNTNGKNNHIDLCHDTDMPKFQRMNLINSQLLKTSNVPIINNNQHMIPVASTNTITAVAVAVSEDAGAGAVSGATSNALYEKSKPFFYNYNNIANTPTPIPTTITTTTTIPYQNHAIQSERRSASVAYNNPNTMSLPRDLFGGKQQMNWKPYQSFDDFKLQAHSQSQMQLTSAAVGGQSTTTTTMTAVAKEYVDLLPAQRHILFEETETTDNAMEAVMGYNPRDDEWICKFTDPAINGCFKGNNCKKKHVLKINDGWTKDRMPITINSRSLIGYPPIGATVTIIPTHIVNVEEFFAQIPSQNADYDVEMKEIVFKMNSTEIRNSYQPYTQQPNEMELVFGLYTDNNWYRARVISVIDEQMVKIFYVDYGNCLIVSLDRICHWDDRFDYFPFQAIKCKLDNVKKNKEYDVESLKIFKDMIINKPISATVMDNIDQLFVTLTDESGYDIGEMLYASGCAKLLKKNYNNNNNNNSSSSSSNNNNNSNKNSPHKEYLSKIQMLPG